MMYPLSEPVSSFHSEDSGVKRGRWGGGEEKRLNVIDEEQAIVCCRVASALVEEEKKEVERNAVQPRC